MELHLASMVYYNLSTYIINVTNCLHSPSVFISSARLDSKPVKSLANMVSRHSTTELHLTPTGYYNIINLINCLNSPSVFISSPRLDSKLVKSLANMVSRHFTMESYILLPRDIIICPHILLMWLTASTHPVCSSARPDSTRIRWSR